MQGLASGSPLNAFLLAHASRVAPHSVTNVTFGSMRAVEEKFCMECGESVKGRTDKKFCSDACRNMYHYRSNNAPINYVRNVVNALKRNRRILMELNDGPEGTKKVHRDKLIQKGYSFMYHTNIYRTMKGNTYVFCFEHGYLEISENWYALVRRDEYLERAGDA